MELDTLPADLPVPVDGGCADHLDGMRLPELDLPATNGELISIRDLPGTVVLYIYPMTGRPDKKLPNGWDQIPGARGCTPQSCAFRDHHAELRSLETDVFGLSSQNRDYQIEVKNRLHLPFELLSDPHFALKNSLKLPTFEVDNREFYKRITLILINGVVRKAFYPVFPPNENAEKVIAWLKASA
ncbi:MAG: peroxiredoxin [Alcanivoracaceae bacterium]|jgi:peroxiredoxin|nr:peroxiredoxin [Alcanivoracaceae bacterium]